MSVGFEAEIRSPAFHSEQVSYIEASVKNDNLTNTSW